MPTIPELPAASATTDESELAIIYKNGTTYKAVLADILALRQQANAILTSLSGLGAGVGFLQKTGPTSFVTTYIPGAGAYDPLGTAQAINDAHNLDTGAHAAAGFAKLGVAQTWTAAQRFDAGTPTVPGLSIGSTSYGLSLDGTAISMAIAGIPRLRFAGTINTQDNYGNSTTLAIRRANGTYAAPTKILSGDSLGQYMFRGAYDVAGVGTWDSGGPYIRAVATEDYNAAGNKGAYLSIAAITTGSGSATESVHIAGDLVATFVPLSVTGNITTRAASTQDGIALLGRSGGTSSYLATLTPPALSGNVTITLPTVTCSLAGFNVGQTWTAAQTFRAIRVEAASTQDAIILAGRAGGSGSYAATIVPGTMSGSVGITLPVASTVLAGLGLAQTWTAAQTFRSANAIRVEAASTQDAIVLAGRAGGTSSYAVTISPTTLTASRTLTLPDANVTLPSTFVALSAANTWTAAQTFRAASGVRSEAAATQDAVVLNGRAGGTSSFAVSITPTALSANRTLTLPDADVTIPSSFVSLTAANTWTLLQTFVQGIMTRSAAGRDSVRIEGGGSGTSSYSVNLSPVLTGLTAGRSQYFCDADGTHVVASSVPASAAAAGVPGQIAASGAGYLYICTGPSTWMRVAIASW